MTALLRMHIDHSDIAPAGLTFVRASEQNTPFEIIAKSELVADRNQLRLEAASKMPQTLEPLSTVRAPLRRFKSGRLVYTQGDSSLNAKEWRAFIKSSCTAFKSIAHAVD